MGKYRCSGYFDSIWFLWDKILATVYFLQLTAVLLVARDSTMPCKPALNAFGVDHSTVLRSVPYNVGWRDVKLANNTYGIFRESTHKSFFLVKSHFFHKIIIKKSLNFGKNCSCSSFDSLFRFAFTLDAMCGVRKRASRNCAPPGILNWSISYC